jgi:biotin transport system substrate-specific component
MTLALDPAWRRPVLAESLLPAALTRSGATIALGVALTALAAQVTLPIPGSPVPVTGQTFAVLVTATALGPSRAFAAQALYLALGVLGLPVFAHAQHGAQPVFGATGGYLIGFLVAALIAGYGARRGADRSPRSALPVMALASAGIYLFGVSWLVLSTGMPVAHAVTVGVVPFLLGDALKVLLAAAALPSTWRALDRFESNTRNGEAL